MVKYRFYPNADAAQDRIWRDTAERWGQTQAIAYIHGLHAHLEKLAQTKSLWRKLSQSVGKQPNFVRETYFSRYEHHLIFFRELSDGSIGVMSILHEKMDVPSRLARELRDLDR